MTFTVERIVRGDTFLTFDEFGITAVDLRKVFLGLVKALVFQSICEYYWHLLMHTGPMYKRFHKFHHHYKVPRPFDDMYIHPIESFGYYCIFFAPAHVLKISAVSFSLYVVILGTCGVIDHSGCSFKVPLLYNSDDHEAHHRFFNVNYAFPFPFMDLLHQTYFGQYCGMEFCPPRPSVKQKM
ncbi:unnamed protein product [Heterosigma akashiwo]